MFKFVLSVLFLALFLPPLIAGAQEVQPDKPLNDGQVWSVINAGNISFYHWPEANLKSIEARLRSRYTPLSAEYKSLLSTPALPIETRISARLHVLLERAQAVLGMEVQIPHLDIKVFKTRKDLADEVVRLTGVPKDYRSFYVHDLKSIYISDPDFIDSVIAHELGHAIIDHYFSVPPPPQVAELLATYVDEHLERE